MWIYCCLSDNVDFQHYCSCVKRFTLLFSPKIAIWRQDEPVRGEGGSRVAWAGYTYATHNIHQIQESQRSHRKTPPYSDPKHDFLLKLHDSYSIPQQLNLEKQIYVIGVVEVFIKMKFLLRRTPET